MDFINQRMLLSEKHCHKCLLIKPQLDGSVDSINHKEIDTKNWQPILEDPEVPDNLRHKTKECEKVIADLKAVKNDCRREKDHLNFILGLEGKLSSYCNQLACLGFNSVYFDQSCYHYMETDTDSIYLALSCNELLDAIKPELQEKFIRDINPKWFVTAGYIKLEAAASALFEAAASALLARQTSPHSQWAQQWGCPRQCIITTLHIVKNAPMMRFNMLNTISSFFLINNDVPAKKLDLKDYLSLNNEEQLCNFISNREGNLSNNIDFIIFSLNIAGVPSILRSINFLVTIIVSCPDLITWDRFPLLSEE
uniref:Uncharacterized protein n=1 Tax=Romanomermis culicivorax TaxID=13658 RepID=A0A915K360_ROMCU